MRGVLIPSPRITDSRTRILVALTLFSFSKGFIDVPLFKNKTSVATLLFSESFTPAHFSRRFKWVWHRRLGHDKRRLISKLSKLQHFKGLPNTEYHSDALCGACQKGKIAKSSFKVKDIVSTSRPLELLQIDLFGPVNTASLYGRKYGLVIVDDYSRWT